MKKIFLGLLALAGMVAGFTLTSCGGGGGGNQNLAGTIFDVTRYKIYLSERVNGSDSTYDGVISDIQGSVTVPVRVVLSEAQVDADGFLKAKGRVVNAQFASEEFNSAYVNLFKSEIQPVTEISETGEFLIQRNDSSARERAITVTWTFSNEPTYKFKLPDGKIAADPGYLLGEGGGTSVTHDGFITW